MDRTLHCLTQLGKKWKDPMALVTELLEGVEAGEAGAAGTALLPKFQKGLPLF